MYHWLLATEAKRVMEAAYSQAANVTAEQQAQFEAANGFKAGDSSRVLTVAGKTAEITISGIMTKAPSFMAMLFGGGNTTYSEINAALHAAENDPNIERIEMSVDSPGGTIDGLFDTIAAMQAVKKPIKAVVSDMAASAAFALVSQADEIVAANRATRFGSVGIVVTMSNDDSRVDITSTNAPNKRPDVNTPEGRAAVVEELDALHEIFVEAIAEGRGVSADTVNAEFGQGGTVLAGEALKRGMIDGIQGAALSIVESGSSNATASHGGDQTGDRKMDLNTLKAQHPDVYAAAVQEGTTQERDRVSAHLIMGEMSGDMATATQAITDGEQMTAKLNATYMAAGMNKRDTAAAAADTAAATAAAAGADNTDATADESDAVTALVEQGLGIEQGGA